MYVNQRGETGALLASKGTGSDPHRGSNVRLPQAVMGTYATTDRKVGAPACLPLSCVPLAWITWFTVMFLGTCWLLGWLVQSAYAAQGSSAGRL